MPAVSRTAPWAVTRLPRISQLPDRESVQTTRNPELSEAIAGRRSAPDETEMGIPRSPGTKPIRRYRGAAYVIRGRCGCPPDHEHGCSGSGNLSAVLVPVGRAHRETRVNRRTHHHQGAHAGINRDSGDMDGIGPASTTAANPAAIKAARVLRPYLPRFAQSSSFSQLPARRRRERILRLGSSAQ